MFSNITNTSSYDVKPLTHFNGPSFFTANTQELDNGLTRALAMFTIVKKNCDNACLKTLDLEGKYRHNKNEQELNTCVNRCFRDRIDQHFPDNKEIKDFVYASAFEYSQKDTLSFKIKNILNTETPLTSINNDVEKTAQTINKYFA